MGYTKVIRSGNLIELYEFSKKLQEKRPQSRKKSNRNTHTHPSRRFSNVSNTRKRIRRIIRANLDGNENPALITCTMYEILPVKASFAAHTAFLASLKRKTALKIRYVTVLEFQKRGACHFHTLIWGLPKQVIDNEKRTRNIQRQWTRGYVDCIHTDGKPALVGYLIKYLQKSMHDPRLAGEKSYSCSRDVLRPMQVAGNTLSDYLGEIIPDDAIIKTHKRFDTEWLGEAKYTAYEI